MVFAKNDIGFVFGNTRFLKCKVSLRKDAVWPEHCKNITLSKLINPSYTKSKGQIVVFCDGIKETEYPGDATLNPIVHLQENINVEEEEEEYKSVELNKEFENKNALIVSDILEERENKYQAEKLVWIKHNSNNKRLINAIEHNYDCDEAYCIERLRIELKGFFLVDHSTMFWKISYPSDIALDIEDELKNKLHGCRSKYGTQIRICLLEEHNHIKYNDAEAVVIINYLGKFDVIGIIDIIGPLLYE